ncbi:MAG: 7-carboxy-7-deazaguanine synthase QueE [Planctomycetota bacterium]|nr:7-carboxy-7-deazaguanine synthase QueE [Planctomycetota bacterium]
MRIADLFHSIQGEGKLAGLPSVFIRTSGCNLRCAWCDTPYASWQPEGLDLSVDQIVRQASAFPSRHVVLTGGEPLIMPDLPDLCHALKSAGFHITLETAATLYKALNIDLASLSPKLANSTPHLRDAGRFAKSHEQHRLNLPVIQQFIDTAPDFQLKFVLSTHQDLPEIQQILTQLRNWQPAHVLLMPEGADSATLASRAPWIVELCKQTGYRYCPRLHIHLLGNQRAT